ncbi:NAD(P)-dependent oxidoreductase [Lachnospiraceae bacterium LCP25S3_G4]
MFKKLVAIEPISLLPEAKEALHNYASSVVLSTTKPTTDTEIIERIGDADAVLVSYTTNINRYVLSQCPSIKYIGMCCSLYSESSANVDIAYAKEHHITVTGIRDYGDEGVVEFVVSELIQLFHGFHGRMWSHVPRELTGLKVGIIGLGTSGTMVANGLQYFGSDISYFSRTRKSGAEAHGFTYRSLNELVSHCEVICTCLNKHTILLHEEQFHLMKEPKILINTGLSPSFDMEPFQTWIQEDNYFICDTEMALDNPALLSCKNVNCVHQSSGMTLQAYQRLSNKVLENIKQFLK